MEPGQDMGSLAACEWLGCADAATHSVDISFPEGMHEKWQVCRAHDRALKVHVVCGRPKAPAAASPSLRVEVLCSMCRRSLDEPTSLPETARQPCPDCGSLSRMHKVTVVETLTVHESLRARSKRPGKGGWMTDIRAGDDYTRCLEAWGTRILETDRSRNVYREVITLYDGTRVECMAQLTDHHD